MRITKLFYLLLVCIVLTWAACDDDDMGGDGCMYEVPEVILSDGECTPELLQFFKLTTEQTGDIPALPKDCPVASPWGKTFRIEPTNDGNIDLHFYNGTRGWASIQAFGVEGCAEDFAVPLTDCISVNGAAQIIKISGADFGFTDIYVTVDLIQDINDAPLLPYTPDDPQAEEYIGFAAYNVSPGNDAINYRGTNPQNELERLILSCDGGSAQRVVIGTCNPNADLDLWKQEIGLEESECYEGEGGTICAMDVPRGLDPDLTDNAIAKQRPRQDTDDYYVDEDFIITVPAPGDPGLFGPGVLEELKQEVFIDCLNFDLGTSSTDEEEDQIVITMIDSGVEFNGNWDDVWKNHVNKVVKGGIYLDIEKYGYDFFNADDEPEDQTGHGTNTAGALIGDYNGDRPLTVVHHKIFGPGGQSTYFGAVVATWEGVKIGSDVINMSWGAYPDERPDALACAIAFAESRDIIVVAAAGNDMENLNTRFQYPAVFSIEFKNVVTVGSYLYTNGDATEVNRVEDFSNFSPFYVTIGGYLSAKTPTYGGSDFNFLAGTSISAPLVSARIAKFLGDGKALSTYLADQQTSSELMDDFVMGRWQPMCPVQVFD